MKHILFSFILILSLLFPAGAFAQRTFLRLDREIQSVPADTILKSFYAGKVSRVNRNLKTYSDRYNAVAFAIYPRTFWADKIPNLPPYDKAGELFKDVLATSYKDIKSKPPVNSTALAQRTLAEIVLNPRRVEVIKNIPFPSKGDIWYGSFYLQSYYIQLTDFYSKISEQEAAYKEYSKYLAKGDTFMASGYENCDFSLVKSGYNKNVFQNRKKDIENFISVYTTKSNAFIRRVLVPMQRDSIPGADVEAFIDAHLDASALPAGVSAKALKEVLLEEIAPKEYYYMQAERIDPSFIDQISSLGEIIFATWRADGQDVSNALSLFEYISPGTLVAQLNKYGKIPSRETVIEDIASSLAAAALNKSLAQIANDLFEFEKPFYYSNHGFASAENKIVENWSKIATNDYFATNKIAQIAADNILKSGKLAKQDRVLFKQINNRRIDKNIKFYEDAVPIAIDFASGDLVYAMAAPLIKGGRYIMAARANTFKASLKGLKYVPEASLAKAGRKAFLEVKGIELVKSTSDNMIRPVWALRGADDNIAFYSKYGNKLELQRTKQIDEIITSQNLRSKYNLLEIEYPRVASENHANLSPEVAARIEKEMEGIVSKVRDGKKRFEVAFTTTKVDVSGFTLANAGPESIKLLNDIPITKEEWKQIVAFYGDLNKSGFYHTDIWNNLHIRRLADGKLKITLLDFEHLGVSDMLELEDLEKALRRFGLREKKGSANYLKEFGPEAAKSDLIKWENAF